MMSSTARALLRVGAGRKSSPGPGLSNLNRFLYGDIHSRRPFHHNRRCQLGQAYRSPRLRQRRPHGGALVQGVAWSVREIAGHRTSNRRVAGKRH